MLPHVTPGVFSSVENENHDLSANKYGGPATLMQSAQPASSGKGFQVSTAIRMARHQRLA
jgi:hypothetical protein